MYHIVIFDLETIKATKPGDIQHIVEIGAVKMKFKKQKWKIIDTFQEYVSPPIDEIPLSTKYFLKIDDDNFKNAADLLSVSNKFTEWIGENYFICSWSDSDINILAQNCIINKCTLKWLKNYNDIQKLFGDIYSEDKKRIGLSNALKKVNISPIGKAHSALFDSINAANIFIDQHDKITLKENKLHKAFEFLSCALYAKCRICRETKYHSAYDKIKGASSKVCIRCRRKMYEEKKRQQ